MAPSSRIDYQVGELTRKTAPIALLVAGVSGTTLTTLSAYNCTAARLEQGIYEITFRDVPANAYYAAPVYPIGSISAWGVATALTVYADTPASGSGSYLGVTDSWAFLVLNSNPDNYGLYAGDQIPDAWQIRYFGTTNPLGQAGATNAGRNNLDSYIADLDPTNPASVFGIVAVSNLPPNRVVYFLPASTARVYALQYGTNLASGSWSNVTPMTNWGNGGVFWLSDTHATSPRFYRVGVQVP